MVFGWQAQIDTRTTPKRRHQSAVRAWRTLTRNRATPPIFRQLSQRTWHGLDEHVESRSSKSNNNDASDAGVPRRHRRGSGTNSKVNRINLYVQSNRTHKRRIGGAWARGLTVQTFAKKKKKIDETTARRINAQPLRLKTHLRPWK